MSPRRPRQQGDGPDQGGDVRRVMPHSVRDLEIADRRTADWKTAEPAPGCFNLQFQISNLQYSPVGANRRPSAAGMPGVCGRGRVAAGAAGLGGDSWPRLQLGRREFHRSAACGPPRCSGSAAAPARSRSTQGGVAGAPVELRLLQLLSAAARRCLALLLEVLALLGGRWRSAGRPQGRLDPACAPPPSSARRSPTRPSPSACSRRRTGNRLLRHGAAGWRTGTWLK